MAVRALESLGISLESTAHVEEMVPRGPARAVRAYPVHAAGQEGARALAARVPAARARLHRHRAHPARPHPRGRGRGRPGPGHAGRGPEPGPRRVLVTSAARAGERARPARVAGVRSGVGPRAPGGSPAQLIAGSPAALDRRDGCRSQRAPGLDGGRAAWWRSGPGARSPGPRVRPPAAREPGTRRRPAGGGAARAQAAPGRRRAAADGREIRPVPGVASRPYARSSPPGARHGTRHRPAIPSHPDGTRQGGRR